LRETRDGYSPYDEDGLELELVFELRTEFGMLPVTIQAVCEFLRELEEPLSEDRPGNKAVY
jgi:hypothetical protein